MLFQLDGSQCFKNWIIFHADRIYYMMCINKLSPYPQQVGSFIFTNVWLHYTVLTLPIYQRICRIYEYSETRQTNRLMIYYDTLQSYLNLGFILYMFHESEGWGFEYPSGRDISVLKNFDTFTRTSVCVSKMNAVAWLGGFSPCNGSYIAHDIFLFPGLAFVMSNALYPDSLLWHHNWNPMIMVTSHL